jgi:hypothetical protein
MTGLQCGQYRRCILQCVLVSAVTVQPVKVRYNPKTGAFVEGMDICFMLCRSEKMEKLLTDKPSYGILHYAKRPDYTF